MLADHAPAAPRSRIARIDRGGLLPLSPDQEFQLTLEALNRHRSEPATPSHTLLSLRLEGPLDREALAAALQALTARHETLRTTFDVSDGPGPSRRPTLRQQVYPSATFALAFVDVGRVDSTAQEAALDRQVVSDALRPFDYGVPPLMRATLVRFGFENHVLFIVAHHLISDFMSLQILRTDVERLYSAYTTDASPSLAPLPIQYVDFAAWQRARLSGPVGASLIASWRSHWARWGAAMASVRDLPICGPRATSTDPGHVAHALDTLATARLKTFTRSERLTLYMVCVAAAQAVIHSYSGQQRIAIWSRFANRQTPGLEGIIGWIATAHLLGAEFGDGTTVAMLLEQARKAALEAYTHQELPFSIIARVLSHDRSSGKSYDASGTIPYVSFDLRTQRASRVGDLAIRGLFVRREEPKNELDLIVFDRDETIEVVARYVPRWLAAADVQVLVERFARLLSLMPDCRGLPVSEWIAAAALS